MHPEDDGETREIQEQRVLQLYDACLVNDRLLLLEVQATTGTTYDGDSVARLLQRFYEIGVLPEWWKIPPDPDPAVWARIGDVVREHDPYCAGLLVLGQAMEEERLAESFAGGPAEPPGRGTAARGPRRGGGPPPRPSAPRPPGHLCRGFAIGGLFYGAAARRWLAGEADDEEL